MPFTSTVIIYGYAIHYAHKLNVSCRLKDGIRCGLVGECRTGGASATLILFKCVTIIQPGTSMVAKEKLMFKSVYSMQ